ncbi:MAG: carbohydrate binding domain-containing protein [Phycisphaeraceae bacterium]|nr:carbohydrate binding domain-containing protein [Phycisphaeraceae bacterium]
MADIVPSERTEPEEPPLVASLVKNSNFEIDEPIPGPSWSTWNPATGDGSTATIDSSDSVDGSGSCRIDGQGSTNWDFYVINRGIPMEVGKTYTLSFWAKAPEPRSIGMLLKGSDNSGPAFCEITAELTTEWTEYTATGECTQPDCKLDIASGGPIPLWLDFVQLYEGEYVQIIPGGREEVIEASNPYPETGAFDAPHDATLAWTPGVTSVTQNVYLGASLDDVDNADTSSDLLVSAVQDANTYAASLDFSATYFWRIDGIDNAGEAIKGTVWSFTTSSFIGIDGMESYSNEEDSRIFNTWKDGYDNSTENGALVGANPIANDYSPETLTVHSGAQSLPIHYANANSVLYSEAKRTFDTPQDWTANGVTTLTLYVSGWSPNSGSLYIKINDIKIPHSGAENALQNEYWSQMYIDLTALEADLLKEVNSMSIGVEGANALGKLYVDDVRLLRQVVEIPAAVAKPVIDGQVDTLWEEVQAHPTDAQRNGAPVESDLDSSGTIQMLWDAENLYVLVDINDEALLQDSANGWDDDRIEIFIDADGSKTTGGPGTQGTDGINDYQYAFSWIPGTVSPIEWYFNGDARDTLAGVDSAVILTDDGYRVEVKLPWSTLLGAVPSAGDFIGIALAVADDDDGDAGDSQVTALMAGDGSPHRPDLWQTARLSE